MKPDPNVISEDTLIFQDKNGLNNNVSANAPFLHKNLSAHMFCKDLIYWGKIFYSNYNYTIYESNIDDIK